jgi:hypothetical protein
MVIDGSLSRHSKNWSTVAFTVTVVFVPDPPAKAIGANSRQATRSTKIDFFMFVPFFQVTGVHIVA